MYKCKCNKYCDESSSDESVDSEQCKCYDCIRYKSRCKKISRCREVNENKQNWQGCFIGTQPGRVCKYCKQSGDTIDTFCSRERSYTERPHSNYKSKSIKKCQASDCESALSICKRNITDCKPPENGNIIFITINP